MKSIVLMVKIYFIGNCNPQIKEVQCDCAKGWGGKLCDVVNCTNFYCSNGVCDEKSEYPKCKCNKGFTGNLCNEIDCESYGCQNGIKFL